VETGLEVKSKIVLAWDQHLFVSTVVIEEPLNG